MFFFNRLKSALIAIVFLIVMMPLAALLAFLSLPLLRWLESHFEIEVVGHSGPAELVFLVIYFALVIAGVVIFYIAGQTNNNQRT